MIDREFKIEYVFVDGKGKLKWHYRGYEFYTWFEVSKSKDDYDFFISIDEALSISDFEYVRNVSCAIHNVGSNRTIHFA